MAGIDRRVTGGEQGDKGWLRPLHMKGGFKVAVGGDRIEVEVPGLARVQPQLLWPDAEQQIPGAFDVGGGKRHPVMPFDSLPQLECEVLAIGAPSPALGEL